VGLEPGHRAIVQDGHRQLGQRPSRSFDRDTGLAVEDDQRVPGIAHVGRDRCGEILVALGQRLATEDTDRLPICFTGASTDGLHHAAIAATDDRVATLGEQPAQLVGALVPLTIDTAAADDADAHGHATSSRQKTLSQHPARVSSVDDQQRYPLEHQRFEVGTGRLQLGI